MENKTCTRCVISQPVSNFNKDKKRKDGLQVQCRKCCRDQARDFYRRNPEPYKTRAKIQRDIVRKYLVEFANRLKVERGCAFCKDNTLCILDFHHLIKGTPVTRVAGKGYAQFQCELNKCMIACANCHRKTHAGLLTATDDMRLNVEVPHL